MMRALVVDAKWSPKAGYKLSEFEKTTGKALCGNAVWKDPIVEIKDIPKPKAGPGEVVIKVKACGICGSDIHFYEKDDEGYILFPGYTKFPIAIGHEFSGIVEEVGSGVRELQPGDWVTAEEMLWCGECKPCRGGYPNQCMNLEEFGLTVNGAIAEYVVIGAKYCWKINALKNVYGDDEDKVFTAGATVEPTSVAYNAIFDRGGGFAPGSYVAIYGAGPIGLAAIQLCKAAGASRVICFERIEERRDLAKKNGADYVLDPTKVDPSEETLKLTDGEGADFQLEAAGDPGVTVPQMEKAFAVNGKIVIVGAGTSMPAINTWKYQTRRAQIYGSQGHSGHNIFPNVIRLIANGRIDPTKFITDEFPLEKGVEAIIEARKRRGGKVMVRI